MDNNNYNQDMWQQQPSPMFTPEPPKKPNYDSSAFTLGIVSIIFALIGSCILYCTPIAIVTGIIGIIAVFTTVKNGYDWNATRVVALILNLVAILGVILLFLFIFLFMNSAAGQAFMDKYMELYNELLNDPSFGGVYYE